jgi:biopolymer transport protein ExbB
MKQSWFITIMFVVAVAISVYIYFGIFMPAPDKTLLNNIYKGGPLVIALMTLTIMVVTFIVERFLSLGRARGKRAMPLFLRDILGALNAGNVNEALQLCEAQRGTLATIIRSALERYQILEKNQTMEGEKKLAELSRTIEESTMLEVPMLERNLIALSTIASISTMIGLLGTVIGMIRAFAALAHAGAPDAIQLSIGISEALINTAGGLIAAISAIIAYNFFVTKVDNFTYMVDEASYSVVQTLFVHEK